MCVQSLDCTADVNYQMIVSDWIDLGDVYAIWRGRHIQFEMKSKRVTIGRASSSTDVDFDLLLEGTSYRISRKQVLYNTRCYCNYISSRPQWK